MSRQFAQPLPSRQSSPVIQMVTPLPPVRSGISYYSLDLLRAIAGRWQTDVLPEPGSDAASVEGIVGVRVVPDLRPAPALIHAGNSDFHRRGFDLLREPGHLLVLHDTVLHSGRLVGYVKRHETATYRRLMSDLYGVAGERAAATILAGHAGELMLEFPLFEDFVSRAAGVVVHSEWAAERVRERVPEARVMVVPMGVPMPHLVDQGEARAHLGLPTGAFIIASITHVNPYKRLDTVLRALQRVVRQYPETILVVAGSIAPTVALQADAEMYGVADNIRLLGYVSDDDARLVARAADICVNLRYPSAGETSASLLRMLGAGRPVIVTDDGPSREIDSECVVRVPIDALEDEYLAEVLTMFAQSSDLRRSAGIAARRYVRRRHGMDVMLAAYRYALRRSLGIDVGEIGSFEANEPRPVFRSDSSAAAVVWREGAAADMVVDAAAALRLGDHTPTLRAIVQRWRELRLA